VASHGTTTQRGYGWAFQKVRPLVLERDGHRCQVQLPGCTGHATAVDHITPGGPATLDNLRAACVPCNSRRARRRRGRSAGPAAPLASASVTW
jgi:5-methylcytosine-specific restriction enzyme A